MNRATTPSFSGASLGVALLTLSLALSFLFLSPAPVQAQSEDCEALRQQMSAASDPTRSTQYARAAERQRNELARTQAYSDQIGCGGFSIFSSAPPQCDAIEAQMRRMENNLSLLESQTDRMRDGNAGQRADLANRYATYCSTASPDPNAWDDNGLRSGTDDGFGDPQQSDGTPSQGRGGKAICVRTCDGGYFPLGDAGSDEGAGGLQSLCSALCPNTEAKLYTTPDTDDLATATSIEGKPYTDLPNAFQFQKTFTATCTCKPAGKTWVEALAQAEALLEKGAKDVTVTRTMSDAMAKPTAATPLPTKKRADKKTRIDLQLVEGAVGAQAPTASAESAGISAGDTTGARVISTGEGQVKDVPGPDGAKRRVRIIGPLL